MLGRMSHDTMLELIKAWLESQGFKAAIAQKKFPIFVRDLIPNQVSMEPDVVGIKDGKVCIVEAETDPTYIIYNLGRSLIWKTYATYVYIAYPADTFHEFKIMERLGLGLLKVFPDKVEEVIKLTDKDLITIYELHPNDPERERAIYAPLKRILG